MADQTTTKQTTLHDLLADSPSNWGRWGPNDEIGALNFLTPAEVMRGIQSVKQGKVVTIHKETGIALPLHCALMRNLGVTLNEICDLEELGQSCAEDKQYTFLYAAAPIKFKNATGAPVNPIVIK